MFNVSDETNKNVVQRYNICCKNMHYLLAFLVMDWCFGGIEILNLGVMCGVDVTCNTHCTFVVYDMF